MQIFKRNFLGNLYFQQLIKDNNFKNTNFLFLLGIIFLASAPAISSIFFVLCLIFSSFKNKLSYFQDEYNYPFFIIGIYLIFSCIHHFSNPVINFLDIRNLSVIGIFNWLPFFWIYWAFENYLSSWSKRIQVIKFYLIGSIPVLLSGLGQYFFNWHGPINILNGLIIWFQRPLASDEGITGLFNNPNYMGCWLAIIFPFSLFTLKICRKNYQKFLISFFIFIILLISLLTYSRSCWSTIIISIPILLGRKALIWFVPFIIISFISIFLASYQSIPESIQLIFRNLLPDNVWLQFSDLGFANLDSSRLEILKNSIILIKEKSIFGWGGGSFSHIISDKTGVWLGHTHNLFIELAFNYGIVPSIILFSTFLFLFIKSFSKKNVFKINFSTDMNSKIFSNKIWWTSTLMLLLTQMVDVQYYDIRISLSLWILITGLKCIIKENNYLLRDDNYLEI